MDKKKEPMKFKDNILYVSRMSKSAVLPTRANNNDAGFDLYTPTAVTVNCGKVEKIPTNLKMAIPDGYCGMVCSRSGLAVKDGIVSHIRPGIIDSGYRGELIVVLKNEGDKDKHFQAGDRVAQLVLTKIFVDDIEESKELPSSVRGEGGFGSSGK